MHHGVFAFALMSDARTSSLCRPSHRSCRSRPRSTPRNVGRLFTRIDEFLFPIPRTTSSVDPAIRPFTNRGSGVAAATALLAAMRLLAFSRRAVIGVLLVGSAAACAGQDGAFREPIGQSTGRPRGTVSGSGSTTLSSGAPGQRDARAARRAASSASDHRRRARRHPVGAARERHRPRRHEPTRRTPTSRA